MAFAMTILVDAGCVAACLYMRNMASAAAVEALMLIIQLDEKSFALTSSEINERV